MPEFGKAPDRSWRAIAEEASQEDDSEKLIILVDALCTALEEEQAAQASTRAGWPPRIGPA